MSSRYAAAYKDPHGPGDARPTGLDVVKDENLEGKLTDKVILITGCSAGIGIETARALAATGARLFLGVRDLAKGRSALADILQPGRAELLQMDLASLASVRAAAAELLRQSPTLNIAIHNAGVMATPQGTTADGFETQFGTNYLSHFLLFHLLKRALLLASTPTFASRVINVSSSGHRSSGILFADPNFLSTPYSPWLAYGQSKTATIYMSNAIDRRYGSRGLHALSLHPGGIMTNLQTHVPEATKQQYARDPAVRNHMRSVEQGAAVTVFAAIGREWEGKGGKYLEDCGVSPPVSGKSAIAVGYAPHAYDEEGEERLWGMAVGMLGLGEGEGYGGVDGGVGGG